jgi:CHAD domain-containing protein
MSYKIQSENSFNSEIKRIIFDLIDHSIQHLEHYDHNPDVAVHETRKNMKKIRAALRLVRYAIFSKSYRKLNLAFRDISRKFAIAREANVKLKTVGELNKDDSLAVVVNDVENVLLAQYRRSMEEIGDRSQVIGRAQDKLSNLKSVINRLSFNQDETVLFYKGLKKIYKQGKKALSDAKRKPDGEHLHEWRKRVKYLWYHLRLLKYIWPTAMKGTIKSLDKLSDDLGEEHDLVDLKHFLLEFDSPESQLQIQTLMERIDKKRAELQSEAWPVGEKLYIEKPKWFTRRIAGYYKIENC